MSDMARIPLELELRADANWFQMRAGRQALTTGRQDLSMTSAIAKELPPYRLDTVNSRHARGERFRVHVLGRFRLLGGDTPAMARSPSRIQHDRLRQAIQLLRRPQNGPFRRLSVR